MKTILIIGAGRSASSLIQYLLNESNSTDWRITIADSNFKLAEEKIAGHPNANALHFDIFNEAQKEKEIAASDIVISMLPASFHQYVALTCIKFSKNMLTASYLSKEMKVWDEEARKRNIILLNECGLDPGIDHMTAMQAIDKIKSRGGELISFKSYTGGLVAPESDNNPWHYKFTWNPRNVVLAGQGIPAKFIRNNKYKYIPYHKLFTRHERVHVEGYGDFEGYPNRNSLGYREVYGLYKAPTLIRGTLRRPGFCNAWNVFVQLGMTDDSYEMEEVKEMTYREFVNSFLMFSKTESVEDKLCHDTGIKKTSDEFKKLEWLGIFENRKIGLDKATPAKVLQKILEEKWVLDPDDRDMIVMRHQFEYSINGQKYALTSAMVSKGSDTINTAMSKTVGWPLGIVAKLILQKKIKAKGVQIPITKEFYEPVITEMGNLGINFIEKELMVKN